MSTLNLLQSLEQSNDQTVEIQIPETLGTSMRFAVELTAKEIIEQFSKKHECEASQYGLFSLIQSSTKFEGEFIAESTQIKNLNLKNIISFDIRHKFPKEVDITLPPNPQDLTPRWKTVPIEEKVSNIISSMCLDLKLPKSEYGILFQNPNTISQRNEIDRISSGDSCSFLSIEKETKFSDINKKKQFGIWLESSEKSTISTYLKQFYVKNN
eukprot:Anaeramoba_ignava/c20948_g1_i2.p2 GENE.c20948_g1_i2~~c20948_g1_i2.p2  ORF type:complete len:212 (+),score=69.14 c20948_g1_i2:15-650(+)